MKKILLPTDFSLNSINAIKYALALFKYDFCKFYILYAYQQDIYESDLIITKETLSGVTKKANENSKVQLKKALQKIKKTLTKFKT